MNPEILDELDEELETPTTEDTPVVTEEPDTGDTPPVVEEPSAADAEFVTVSEFNTYTNNYEDSNEVVSLKTTILHSAQEVVSNYLGYKLKSQEYADYISGIGQNRLYLFAQPVTEVTSVLLNGVAVTDYTLGEARYLRLNNGVWPVGVENVLVQYTAGWTAQTLPELVKMVILQIASLMLQETNGNIGITGKSFAENSRTFINYSNFDKWLKKLDSLRIVRLV